MPGQALEEQAPTDSARSHDASPGNDAVTIFACVDRSASSRAVVAHSRSVADALAARLTLVHVIDPDTFAHAPYDPVEWSILRRDAEAFTATLAAEFAGAEGAIGSLVLEGRCADRIVGCGSGSGSNILALARGTGAGQPVLGDTIMKVLATGANSMLVVPAFCHLDYPVAYERIVVPLDGSPRAESALAIAARIARAQAAQLVLVHAAPEPELTRIEPYSAEDEELLAQIRRRNERVARRYLDRLRRQLSDDLADIAIKVLSGGDVRRLIAETAVRAHRDLLVLASHGRSGYGDVPIGDIAQFVLARSPAPVLLMRTPRHGPRSHAYAPAHAGGLRRPTGRRR